MSNEFDYAALHAIGFATGAALSTLLWFMQRRVDRATGAPSGYQLLWIVGIIWTLGSFLRYLLQLAGADTLSIALAGSLAWSSTILGPVAIGRFLQARLGAGRASRMFLIFTRANSVLNLVLFVRAGATHALDVDTSWYPETSLYLALLMTAIALLLARFHRRDSGQVTPRWLGRGALLLAVVHVTAALLTLQDFWPAAGLRAAAGLISEHWVIPWSILIAVSLAQAHYADLVLKRSFWLLACVFTAVLASAFVFRVPPGLPTVFATLGCASLMLVAPSLRRMLNMLVDRMILRRADYAAALSAFEETLRRMDEPVQIVNAAVDVVQTTLRLEARFVLAGEAGNASALASIPIETEHRPVHRLELSARHHARSLMQEEFGFLNTVVMHTSRRLDAVHFEQQQRALHLRQERLKRLLTEAELRALRTQVDPHFLFNTLNTIADLITSNPEQAERMTERLAECFRYALSRHSGNLSTLDDELEFARHYLEIEQVRFGDRLRVELSRGDATGHEPLPSLLLQPLLENAIRHGLSPLREGGCVSVIARREDGYLRLQIDDDGVGLRSHLDATSGVGLQNVRDRLQTMYSQAAKLVIGRRPDGRGTSVTILVPVHAD